MNTWRNKGYVPDSDDDEDFESQESRKGYTEEHDHPSNNDVDGGLELVRFDGDREDLRSYKIAEEQPGQHSQPVELGSNDADNINDVNESAPIQDESSSSDLHEDGRIVDTEDAGFRQDKLRTSVELGSDGKDNDEHGQNKSRAYIQSPPSVDVWSNEESVAVIPTRSGPTSPRSPSADRLLICDNDADSSDDELQLVPVVSKQFTASRAADSVDIGNELLLSDEDESPLSSAPSSIVSAEPSQQALQFHTDRNLQVQNSDVHGTEKAREQNAASQSLLTGISAPETPAEFERPRRSLRERKEIQKHPYQLEDAKYQSLFRKAGLKPVRVITSDSAPARSQEESQETIINAPEPPSSPVSEIVFPLSSPPNAYNSPISARQRTPKETTHSTRDLDRHHSQKRRKLFHDGHVRKNRQQTPSISVVIEAVATSVGTKTAQLVQAPPSPPGSGSVSSSSHLGKDGFRFPRGFAPPAKISDTTPQSVSVDTEDLTIDVESQGDESVNFYDHIYSQSSDEDKELEENVPELPDMAVRQYQRRIKGVLPASWLTLDLKNKGDQTKNSSSDRYQRELLAPRAGPQRGVARPIARARSTAVESRISRESLAFLADSSDSDTAEVVAPANIGTLTTQQGRNISVNLRDFDNLTKDMDEDIPEDNRLDEVFSPVRRSSSGQKKSRFSIPKTYKRKQVYYKNNQPEKKSSLRQMRLDDNAPRPPKRKAPTPCVPDLSILDAPDVTLKPRKEQPQFLRVATRQARSRKDQGRSSPSKKVFNMATREETKETNQALRDWKKGSMKQAKLSIASTPRSVRQPLQNLSTNRPNRVDRNHTSSLPNDSITEERPPHLEDLDLTTENTAVAPSANVPAETRVTSKVTKLSRLVRRNVITRKHAITSLRRDVARPVESEIVGGEAALSPSPYAFSASLAALRKDRKRTFTLDRYISSLDSSDHPPAQYSRHDISTSSEHSQARKKVPRKRVPNRAEVIDIDPMPQITASSEPVRSLYTTSIDDTSSSSNKLYGFGNYGVFSIDFNILPIRKGTYFHHSTFIGDGGLARSLDINKRNMDQDAGFAVIDVGDQIFRWGPWTEMVSSEFDIILQFLRDNMEKQGSSRDVFDIHRVFDFLIRWITENLHFIDPIDRVPFIDRVEILIRYLRDYITTASHVIQSEWKDHLRLGSLNTVLANQIRQIASHELVDPNKRDGTLNLLKSVFRQLLSLVYTRHGLENIRQLYEKSQDTEFHESGIRHDHPAVEAHVIVFHILHSSQEFQGWFDELVELTLADKVSSWNIQHLEDVWEAVFTTLPLNEIDEFGLGRPGLRFRLDYNHWAVVQTLISKVLDAYSLDSNHPTLYIKYCRVVFQRCLLLMISWGFRNCKGVLGTLFDFYAKNMMYNLKTEDSSGSPSFLESLDTHPTIDIEPQDSSFHLFLKILSSGLRYLSQIHDKKTMRNIAWRLLPNHGRVYPKEKPLAHEDLDALRNHHDLLCTLYWAVPDTCRPRLQTIRDLIDPATSHLETTSLSIRSWRRLVHFKLSTNEEDAGLKPFADWYISFASEMIRQHQLAKTEAEAQAKNLMQFSKKDIDATVSHNQRQIEFLISSTIAAMDSAIQSSRSFNQACLLVEGFPIAKVFEIFDPSNSRVTPIICNSLQLVINFLAKDSPLFNTNASATNDDSQEYGDWSAFEEVLDDGITEPAASTSIFPYLQETIQPQVSHLLSNCFGEDSSPEDSLLLKLTECWSCLAHASVRTGLQHWDSYLNPYSGNSWAALRMTSQTRKFGPQFVATCVEKDNRFFYECRVPILSIWVSSLMERKSALKFQHRLTEVLLNIDRTPLIKNLPFYRGKDGQYRITLTELTERRPSLISSLLSNMREHLQNQEKLGSSDANAMNEYRELLRAMMVAMKTNYQELGQSGKAVQGQYVEFVHSTISSMQQHTQFICPLDMFFTDPSTFPLPPGDPGLNVAKLKGYGVRLPALKAAKELVNFMRGLCESAALDGKQNDLVDQLCESMGETYESGDTANPTLRSFLFHSLFSAYIECALSNAAAWIFVLPIMKAVIQATRDLFYDIDINDIDCIKSVQSMFGAILRAIRHVIQIFLRDADYADKPRALLMLKYCIEMICAMFPILDYINRNDKLDDQNTSLVKALREHTALIAERLLGSFTFREVLPGEIEARDHLNSLFVESHAYTIRQVQTYLRTNWSKHDNRYFVRRGRGSEEVTGGILDSKEIVDVQYAKSSLVETANDFLHRCQLFDQSGIKVHSNPFEQLKAYEDIGEDFNELLL